MECLPDSWKVLSNLSAPEQMDAKLTVLQALQKAQRVEVSKGITGAHGDMRLPNVAVRREGQDWHVRFLDFDWAGSAKEHTYPPFMNSQIKWPPGTRPYAVMLSEHDVLLLEQQFDA